MTQLYKAGGKYLVGSAGWVVGWAGLIGQVGGRVLWSGGGVVGLGLGGFWSARAGGLVVSGWGAGATWSLVARARSLPTQ